MRIYLIGFFLFLLTMNSKANGMNSQDTIIPGTDTVVIGIAEQSKAGAILITSDGTVFYFSDLMEWDRESWGKKVKVTGTYSIQLTTEEDLGYNKKEYAQGVVGYQYVFHRFSRWELVK